jgi:hypothetical protein
MVLLLHVWSDLLRLAKRRKQSCAPAKKEKTIINVICLLLLPVFDWPNIMIGPGGLLLVVSHLFAVPVKNLVVGKMGSFSPL